MILPHQYPDRTLRHPGQVQPGQMVSHAGDVVAGTLTLPAGSVLMHAIGAELTARGIRAAALDLSGIVLGPMNFVMPTWSKSFDHVAYYSNTHHRDEPVHIESGTATYGEKDGAPFLHAHLLWHDADGHQRGGHILPFESVLAEECSITFTGCQQVEMSARPDAETNFTLFAPRNHGQPTSSDLIVAQLRPNADLIDTIEKLCRCHGVTQGHILSLIGSTVGARFDNGVAIDDIPTEILGLEGSISPRADGSPQVDLRIALIDASGMIHFGVPSRGQNPILICAEIFIQRYAKGSAQ